MELFHELFVLPALLQVGSVELAFSCFGDLQLPRQVAHLLMEFILTAICSQSVLQFGTLRLQLFLVVQRPLITVGLLTLPPLVILEGNARVTELLFQRDVLVHKSYHTFLGAPIKLHFQLFKFVQCALILALPLLQTNFVLVSPLIDFLLEQANGFQ